MTEQLSEVGMGLGLETVVAPFAYEEADCESRWHGKWPGMHEGVGEWYYVSACPMCQDEPDVILMCEAFRSWHHMQDALVCGECGRVSPKTMWEYRFVHK